MMNKFAIVFLTAAMTLGSGAVVAANNTGNANQAADAGAKADGAKEKIAPNNVDNNDINNTGSKAGNSSTMDNSNMSTDKMDKNTQCKDGKCPDVNNKAGQGIGTNPDDNTQ